MAGRGGAASGGSGSGGSGIDGAATGGAGSGGSGSGPAASGGAGGIGSGGAAGDRICTGQVVAASSPVTLATTIDCTAGYHISIAARAATDEAYVAFTTFEVPVSHVQLASITRSGVTIESTGIAANMAAVVLDASDAPSLVGGEIDNRGVAWFTRSTTGWLREMVSAVPTDADAFYTFAGAAFGGDGQPRVLYWSLRQDLPLLLAKRSPASGWSSTQIAPANSTPAALAIDTKGRARVVFTQMDPTGHVLEDEPEGLPARTIALGSDLAELEVAAGLNGTLAAAKWVLGTIRLVVSDGETAAREQMVPTSLSFAATCLEISSCQSGTCKYDEAARTNFSIASTSDGAFWLAYGVDHVDKDITAAYTTGESHICQMTVNADRTTEEVVLIRVVPGDATASSARWRVSTPAGSLTGLGLVARGSRLDLVLSERSTRTFALDWQNL